MSVYTDLPASSQLLVNDQGNGAMTGAWTTDGFEETLSWSCTIEDFIQFLTVAGGKTQTFGTGTGSTITRVVPLQSPHFTFLYARSLTYKFVGSDGNINTKTRPATHAIVTINFRTPTYNVSGAQAYQTVNINGGTQFITVPGQNYTFSSGEKIQKDIGIQVATLSISVTLHQVPSLDNAYSILAPVLGLVNGGTLTIGSSTFATGTVLFDTFSSTRQNMIGGQISQELTYSLVYRQLPWNSGITSSGTVDTITPAPYTMGDLSQLFY